MHTHTHAQDMPIVSAVPTLDRGMVESIWIMYSVLEVRKPCWPVVHKPLEHTTAGPLKMLVYSAHVSHQPARLAGCVMYYMALRTRVSTLGARSDMS